MDQAENVNALQGAGRRHHLVRAAADRLGGGKHKDGTQALAGGEDAVAQGLVQGLRLRGCGRQMMLQRGLDVLPTGG